MTPLLRASSSQTDLGTSGPLIPSKGGSGPWRTSRGFLQSAKASVYPPPVPSFERASENSAAAASQTSGVGLHNSVHAEKRTSVTGKAMAFFSCDNIDLLPPPFFFQGTAGLGCLFYVLCAAFGQDWTRILSVCVFLCC